MTAAPPSEHTPLLSPTSPASTVVEDAESPPDLPSAADEQVKPLLATLSTISTIGVLLIGVFISNADTFLILVNYNTIASEFNSLSEGSWIITSYALAGSAAQPINGKLSDIFGRKPMLIISKLLFILGCLICGLSKSIGQVITGRIISGIGSAGMISLVSIILTDLLPLRDVAAWQGYINVIAVVGRSVGGPLGGFLADTIGWRWSFLVQCPVISVAVILCWAVLPNPNPRDDNKPESSTSSKLKRIDFLGGVLVILSILSFMIPLEIGGQKITWTHPLIIAMVVGGILLTSAFVIVETKWAQDPILSMGIFTRPGVTITFAFTVFQLAAQTGLIVSVPAYFQVTERSSATVAGAHMLPAVIGNAIGGIGAGIIISRTGRYKLLLLSATVISGLGYFLVYLRWRGNTNFWESLYILLGGMGTGIAQPAIFISLTSNLEKADIAVGASALFLVIGINVVSTITIFDALMKFLFRRALYRNLSGVDNAADIIRKSLSNVDYVNHLTGVIREKVVDAYLAGFKGVYALSLLSSAIGFAIALLLKERRL